MKKNNLFWLLIIICPLLIGLYGYYTCNNLKTYKDYLTMDLFNNSSKKYGLDGWSVTHLLFYMLLAYLFPNKIILTVSLGIIWELVEMFLGIYIVIYKPDIFKEFGSCSTDNTKIWWYGKFSDIIVNFIGFIIGQYLALN